ncbi:MAG: glycosyltransferase family 2 protein [Acidobacteria bacterium]|nr:glycosyltransferase family 2 protein [Acidobacteriota bacterium]
MSSQSFAESPSFSIVVPLFNEEENVPLLIEKVFREVGSDPTFLELVLVDDGSHDRTASFVQEHMRRESRIRLVSHDRNRGLGAAIRTGLRNANGDLVLYTDADLPFDFSLIPKLISLGGADHVVLGCRLNRGEGSRRWVLTKGYNFLIRVLFGLKVRDVNFACKVLPQTLVQVVNLKSEGSFIDAEILLEARRYGLEIVEFPLTYFPRALGLSTLSRPQVIFGILREMASYLKTSLLVGKASLPIRAQKL